MRHVRHPGRCRVGDAEVFSRSMQIEGVVGLFGDMVGVR
jgi:hypothetical protein